MALTCHVRLAVVVALGLVVNVSATLRAADAEPPYRARFPVVNVHQHCAVATEAAVRAELAVMDRVGVRTVVILDAGSPEGSLPAWLALKRKFPERLVVFLKISFARAKEPGFFKDLVSDLEAAAKGGVQGVKVWKDLGMYARDASGKLIAVDDPRLDPFWTRCGELGLPVLIHTADPREYWYPLTFNSLHYSLRAEGDQHYHNPEMPRWEELMRQRDRVLKKHPRTQFIGAHFGSLTLDLQRLAETFDRYPNFCVDCAARQRILGRLNPPAVRDFFGKYQDRILFGTDGLVVFKGRKPSKSGNISVYPSDDPDWLTIDTSDTAAVRHWQDREVRVYREYFRYFETDAVDLTDPSNSGGGWLRLAGAKLPPAVLEKFYHVNAERIIPRLARPADKP
jgi:predicted TIM-barrel fold metal-dependent hydrolase